MQGQTPVRTFFFWYVIENVRSIKVIKSEGKNLGLQQHYSAAAASLSKWRFLLNAWTGQKRNFGSFYRNSSQLLHCMRGGHDFGNLLMDFPSPKNPLEKKETGPDHKTCKILSGKKFHFCHIHQKNLLNSTFLWLLGISLLRNNRSNI